MKQRDLVYVNASLRFVDKIEFNQWQILSNKPANPIIIKVTNRYIPNLRIIYINVDNSQV